MKSKYDAYVCPYTHSALSCVPAIVGSADSAMLELRNQQNDVYRVIDGLPHFLRKDKLTPGELAAVEEYDSTVAYYDNAIEWLFASFYENEASTRGAMVDLLEVSDSSRVLEVAAGTGRDSHYIAAKLGVDGELFVQDIADSMVRLACARLAKSNHRCRIESFVSSASQLPFSDNYFDALYTFGGFNEFSDPAATLREFSRVVKPGGKIVFGDENIAPWLEDTEYGEVIKTNNPIFRRTSLPLRHLPENSKDVRLRWIIGNCFYLIDFRVGDSTPKLNLDLPHKGWRGGTLRTRYFGQLEGVTPETKARVIKAAKESGKSVHQWLEDTLNGALGTRS